MSTTVLHVDNDPAILDVAAKFLERREGSFSVRTETSPAAALDRLADERIDCIVSDYRMVDMDGLEFLKAVREEYPGLPFILFTGKGSEEIASEAISAGVTDYLQKVGSADQYTILANRIENAVGKWYAERDMQRAYRAIETANEGISLLDDDGRFIYVNEAYADIYGYDPDGLIGEHWTLLYHDEDLDYIESDILPRAYEEGRWRGETRGIRKDGTTIIEDHSLAITDDGQLICAVRDITERRDRQRELERHETFLEALGAPVYALDADGCYTFVNEAWVETFGYTRKDVLGEPAAEKHPDEDVAHAREIAIDLLEADGRRTATCEMAMETADGDRIPVENHFALLPFDEDEGGEFRGTAGVLLDVSERKEREQELQRRKERLEEFASVVSHDLRNPLRVAEGRIELARSECESGSLDSALDALDRMKQLIERTLTLAHSGQVVGEPEPVDPSLLAEECWQRIAGTESRPTAQLDELPRIEADPERLSTLFENLYRNAIEHGGEEVTVRVGALTDGFYIEDDGPGIPEGVRDEVLAAGYSTTEDGTGLGLSIARQIAEAHGWGIDVTESEDGGARFEITGIYTVGQRH